MKRRDLIKAIAGDALAWPLAARAQRGTRPVIGSCMSGHLKIRHLRLLHFAVRSLNMDTEGQNVTIEYRWGLGHYDQMPTMAAELVRLPVDVILAGPWAVPPWTLTGKQQRVERRAKIVHHDVVDDPSFPLSRGRFRFLRCGYQWVSCLWWRECMTRDETIFRVWAAREFAK
jgi:hypothetical protein